MTTFSWEYLSYYTFDQTWIYREVLLLPVVIAVLWFLWMRAVNATMQDKSLPQAMDIGEAYHEAIIQDALSTDDEGDDEQVTFKKEDLNAKKED